MVEPDSINLAIMKTLKYSSHSKNIHNISIPSHTWLGKMIKIESNDTTLTNSPKPLVDVLQLAVKLVTPNTQIQIA